MRHLASVGLSFLSVFYGEEFLLGLPARASAVKEAQWGRQERPCVWR